MMTALDGREVTAGVGIEVTVDILLDVTGHVDLR